MRNLSFFSRESRDRGLAIDVPAPGRPLRGTIAVIARRILSGADPDAGYLGTTITYFNASGNADSNLAKSLGSSGTFC